MRQGPLVVGGSVRCCVHSTLASAAPDASKRTAMTHTDACTTQQGIRRSGSLWAYPVTCSNMLYYDRVWGGQDDRQMRYKISRTSHPRTCFLDLGAHSGRFRAYNSTWPRDRLGFIHSMGISRRCHGALIDICCGGGGPMKLVAG